MDVVPSNFTIVFFHDNFLVYLTLLKPKFTIIPNAVISIFIYNHNRNARLNVISIMRVAILSQLDGRMIQAGNNQHEKNLL